ncbi:MAG: thiamine pyrophosphate-dependent dehydrogenase E1 component subunit alpha [Bacillota bacterium]|nr:thiamine pyrophosphate-dependent dehydrogenase E1 component subunit alpha [Bacillota bacterium]
MVRIRAFEEKVEELFLAGKIPGFVHLYIGEEGVASGVCASLDRSDYIVSTHRGHGHCIAKGASPRRMMAEILGKSTGYCKGKGGSMHIADFSVGMLGANGVVGGGFNIAVGAALSAKMRRSGQVAVCFFGDGASNRGTFHEAMNMASVFDLPCVFVCEHNQYASTTPSTYSVSVKDVADRAVGYGIPGVTVDGNDVLAVYEAAREAIARARQGGGPTLLEAKTYRIKGHFVGDPERYRDRSEVERWREKCPILRFEDRLRADGVLGDAEMEGIRSAAHQEILEAVSFAEESAYPDPDDAFSDLYASCAQGEGCGI